MNMNTLIVGLLVYSIVTTCNLFVARFNNNEPNAAFESCVMNLIISVVCFAIIMGFIKVFIFFQ